MAKVTGRNAYVAIQDGATTTVLTNSLNSVTLTQDAEAPEVSVFGQQNRARMHDGIKDWNASVEGYWEGSANQIDEVLFGAIAGGSTMFHYGPTGSTSGSVKYSACAILQDYEMNFSLEDAGTVSATFVARTGSMTRSTF